MGSLMLIYDQFGMNQNLQMSPIPQTSSWSLTFFCRFLQQTGSSLWAGWAEQHLFLSQISEEGNEYTTT